MQFVGVAHVGPGIGANFVDGRGIEASNFGEHRFGQHAAHFDGASAALFERGVVEIGVRIRVQNLMREGRGYRRIDGEAADAARGDVAQDALEACRCPWPR